MTKILSPNSAATRFAGRELALPDLQRSDQAKRALTEAGVDPAQLGVADLNDDGSVRGTAEMKALFEQLDRLERDDPLPGLHIERSDGQATPMGEAISQLELLMRNRDASTAGTAAVTDTAAPSARGEGSANARLAEHYPRSYDQVEQGVKRFYPTNKRNGCVAYMSEALRQAGVPVPIRAGLDGENISLTTRPFAHHLQTELGWNKITDPSQLRPGDVVLTQDDPSWPGYPAHTYMFEKWIDQQRGIASVVDNQANSHARNIFQDRYQEYNFTPFAYALRSPGP